MSVFVDRWQGVEMVVIHTFELENTRSEKVNRDCQWVVEMRLDRTLIDILK